jgi:hypothetical protein
VEYDPTIAPAQGVSTGGRIRLMPDMPPAEEFSVLAHELAHEMMHHDKAAAPLPKVVRETQAEAVAFVVCRGIGLETNNAAADYIALYNGDQKTLADSLAAIQRTSARFWTTCSRRNAQPASQEKASVPVVNARGPEVSRSDTPVTAKPASGNTPSTHDETPTWDR